MDADENLIIEGLKNGEEDAYRYLFDHHYPTLCRIAMLYVKDGFAAETVVSDVIYHVWETRKRLVVSTSLRQFLARSVRNKCLDYLKQQYLKHEKQMPAAADVVANMAESGDYPLGRLLEQELEDKVHDAVNGLPEDCRRVFLMSRVDGLKREEIAEKLDISVNTVKYHLKNALSLLNDELGKYMVVLLFMHYFK